MTVHLAKTTLNEVHDVSLGLEVECRYLGYYVFVWFPLNSNEEKQDNNLQNGSNEFIPQPQNQVVLLSDQPNAIEK